MKEAAIAVALGMDAFSAALAIGMQLLPLRFFIQTGLWTGLCHIIFPELGIMTGTFLSGTIQGYADFVSAWLLVALGTWMMFGAGETFHATTKKGLALFILGVSVDSFPVGVSAGLGDTDISVVLIGVVAALMTWTGFIIGRKAGSLFGSYSEQAGGMILCLLGLQMIFH
ncbi:manganese efflux pump MntP [Salimicrobium halophilum]|uniref:Putative Mn2+ efflux pump MntP n=1 Tax=Salimicrobium halophilum TaxID=86666 RepID=A0A1G8SHB6_9BACI|nr:manganese efflux pump [Salimicrobium halophilum]SDJ28626.1 Putative Mn2+ efflux pump MntP [Salimicrobium halophilum]